MKKTKRLVLLALLVSQAMILSLVESWIPIPAVIPGVKLGLANIITLISIMFLGFKDALLVVLVRCLLSAMFGGGIIIFIFSITGGILSTIVMAILYRKLSKLFSTVGVSVAGAVTHNMGQLLAASIIMRELSVFGYLPVLLISGIAMGFFIGLCSNMLSKSLIKSKIFDNN